MRDCGNIRSSARYSLKYLVDAYKRYRAKHRTEGKPRFKARHCTVPALIIPCKVRIREGRLCIPKVDWLRLGRFNPYADCKPLTVRIRWEVSNPHPKWYAYVCHEVPIERTRQPAADGVLGLDRNVGQTTDSDGVVYAMLDTERLDAQIGCKQNWGPKDRRAKSNRGRRVNGQLSKLHRKRRRQVSRTLASGWGGLELKLAYKAGEVIKVNPAYMSQTCSRCGYVHKANRPS